jgi:hypothetical protein
MNVSFGKKRGRGDKGKRDRRKKRGRKEGRKENTLILFLKYLWYKMLVSVFSQGTPNSLSIL